MKKMCTDDYRRNDLIAFNGEGTPEYQRLAAGLVHYREIRMKALKDGMSFDLGGRVFEVIEIPGHTPGCVCLLNEAEGVMFTGDMIVETPVWLYLKHSLPLVVYDSSLQKIKKRKFDILFPGHQPAPLGRENLEDLIVCTEEILAEPGIGKLERTFAGEGLLWKHGRASIIYDPQNLSA
jgi:hydroxyacylglutathione hydrolase